MASGVCIWSPSSRRAWIEIQDFVGSYVLTIVALLAEGVDRNGVSTPGDRVPSPVALLAEGVDRNNQTASEEGIAVLVALLAEGVDRNSSPLAVIQQFCVALLAEGVDRNTILLLFQTLQNRRPPRGGRG